MTITRVGLLLQRFNVLFSSKLAFNFYRRSYYEDSISDPYGFGGKLHSSKELPLNLG